MSLYWKYIRKHLVPFIAAISCVICEALCDLLGPTIMAKIINEGVETGSLDVVLKYGAIMLTVTALGACFATGRNILASNVSQRIGADLRFDMFAKVLRFSEESADAIESGSLITRLTNDSSQVTQAINGVMRIFLKAPITCVGSIVLATMLNPRLALIIYAVVIVVGGLIFLSMKLSYPLFSRLQKAMDHINSDIQEYLIGVRLVKAFGTAPEEESKFDDANRQLMKQGISSQRIITVLSPLMSLAIGFGTAGVIWLGAALFEQRVADPGDISAFTVYMAQILGSLMMITNIFNVFVRTKASAQRVREVFNSGEDFTPTGDGFVPDGSISFENVTFAYPGGSGLPALRDLSFSVNAGENLAIIGPTGSGKSTICWLLLRFYDAGAGRVTVGGRDIRTVDIDVLRRSVAIVPQKAALFSGTVAYNLSWGDPGADAGQMREALTASEAQFVDTMPQGIDSLLGSGGVNVSGGQKQRLSIARGLLKKSPILILDDATSALDAITEARVRRNLNRTEGRTVITVTQRCTTAMFADKILVMDNGRSVGFGTHEQLLRSCEVYRDIYRSQVDASLTGEPLSEGGDR